MRVLIIYFITIFLSNTVGAASGMGGGVIIKPVLDFIGLHSLSAIAFYSSTAVFTMSVSSTYKQLKNGVQINLRDALSISAGSLIGGVLGDYVLSFLLKFFQADRQVQIIQNIFMIVTLVLVLLYNQRGKIQFKLSGIFPFFIVGITLGMLSTFLGIGGGPINVAALILFFGMEIKLATVYSIITIFFSQIAKLSAIGLTTGFHVYDLTILWVVIPAALLGGYAGGLLSEKLTDQQVKKLYSLIILLVLVINGYNLYMAAGLK
ncbi:sulfite exporter TauE/SafE family protein [Enterococcus sp. BWT-B8]|uniref:sulfite exporter TauE/SafE family protein n=1 Tax=unclassified Enterococcus TaxID=2608891 RepID=UPI001E5B647B|nr:MULTISPECIES: sulfite exporter TauE/SafE family protein [unclassified Enterococcus]MCB5951849.1 sulfite exporter TauE/SafE family protein [Enterococcus sp. BWT-B8]MCB5954046.1 sulfite exporter TauE/SafE family protein [Enterococcus sp. CWB-B31]